MALFISNSKNVSKSRKARDWMEAINNRNTSCSIYAVKFVEWDGVVVASAGLPPDLDAGGLKAYPDQRFAVADGPAGAVAETAAGQGKTVPSAVPVATAAGNVP